MQNALARVIAFGILATSAIAFAAPPEVTSLFPAGARRGTSVAVTIQGKFGDGVCQTWCSQRGIKVTISDKPGPLLIEVDDQAKPGVYWLRFYNDDGASEMRPFVVGTCDEVNEFEPNDDIAIGQPLPKLPVVVNGQHGKNGDADSFAVSLKRGQVIVASLMAHSVLGSPQDAVLQILGPDGFVLEQNEDEHGIDPQLAFTAPKDGIYTLRTWAFPAIPDSSIRLFGNPSCVYRLYVTSGPFVDHLVPAAVQGGKTHSVQLHGWNIRGVDVPVSPPVSAIRRRFEWPIEGWMPTSVIVEPHQVGVEVEPNELSGPQIVSCPVSVTGKISKPRDVDAYQLAVKKGERLRFEVLARESGSPLDAVLRLYDPSGKMLREADDDGKQSADPDIEFVVPADGEYRVTVTDRFLHAGDRFWYVLAITHAEPDFSLSVATDVFKLQSGEVREIPVTVTRAFGFSGEILVGLHGVPAGIAEPVKSEGTGESAKGVKLNLKTDAQSKFSGPIRIWGRSLASPEFERSATFGMRAFGAKTAELWLTAKGENKKP